MKEADLDENLAVLRLLELHLGLLELALLLDGHGGVGLGESHGCESCLNGVDSRGDGAAHSALRD